MMENKELKIQYGAQKNDHEELSKQNAKLKRENSKIRDEFKDVIRSFNSYKIYKIFKHKYLVDDYSL